MFSAKKDEMKPEELRIGNLIIEDIDEGPIETEVCNWHYEAELFDKLSPIPLTEERLEKFGFEEDANEYHIKTIYDTMEETRKFHIALFSKGDAECNIESTEWKKNVTQNIFLTHIKHVHQLQNLFYALTGKELERKEVTA